METLRISLACSVMAMTDRPVGRSELDEMQSAFLGLMFDAKTDASHVLIPSGPSLLPRGTTAGPTLAAVK